MSTFVKLGWFVLVGCTAAAVHFAVVVGLVSTLGLPPLAANVLGWLVAFVASFLGQWQLTFRAHGAPWLRALRRFFVLSLTGFAINETSYAILLRWTPWRYDVLLALVLVGVAVMTYWLGSRWAFRGSPRV